MTTARRDPRRPRQRVRRPLTPGQPGVPRIEQGSTSRRTRCRVATSRSRGDLGVTDGGVAASRSPCVGAWLPVGRRPRSRQSRGRRPRRACRTRGPQRPAPCRASRRTQLGVAPRSRQSRGRRPRRACRTRGPQRPAPVSAISSYSTRGGWTARPNSANPRSATSCRASAFGHLVQQRSVNGASVRFRVQRETAANAWPRGCTPPSRAPRTAAHHGHRAHYPLDVWRDRIPHAAGPNTVHPR